MPNGKSVYHIATRFDYEAVLQEVESAFSLKYIIYESRIEPDFPVYFSAIETPNFDIAQYAAREQNRQLIVLPRDAELAWEYLPNRKVPEKYCFLGQIDNPQSVIFLPSKYYTGEGGPALLWGQIGTISDDPDSQAIFKAFKKAIRKRFVYVDECYLGPEARQMLRDGIRLTQDALMPREHDALQKKSLNPKTA